MEIEEKLPCVVWNQEDGVWVLPSANDLSPGTLNTISEAIDKLGSPIKARYPGHTETVETTH